MRLESAELGVGSIGQNQAMTSVLLTLYVLAVVASLVLKTPIVKGPWLFLLRAFFPNWKFFHAVGHVPHLYARAASIHTNGECEWSDWQWIYPRRQRRWFHLFHNADVNLGLAQQNLVDHFWADLYDLPSGADAQDLVTYELVVRLVKAQLRLGHPTLSQFQFELRMELSNADGVTHTDTMMRSPELSC